MSRILKVSQSDYRVKVQDGGTITLDTGTEDGLVVITGDLKVLGNTTTIDTANMVVEDNILLLNREVDANGDPITHTGITLGQAGIEVDRGTLTNAQLVFDENVTHYDPLTSADKDGTFVFKTADDVLSGIQLNSITTTGTTDLVFDMQGTNKILKVENSDASAYANRLGVSLAPVADTAEDNFIPNKKFILGYIAATGGSADVSHIQYPASSPVGSANTSIESLASSLRFSVNQTKRAEIKTDGLYVDFINLFESKITAINNSYDLSLTSASGLVEVDSVLSLTDQTVNPSSANGKTKIYSKLFAGPGKSGLFFINNTTADELVAKNRALLFSMIF